MAQTSKGIIAGVITDNTGAVVVGAHVTAKSTLSGETRTVLSRTGGAYRIEAVNPGIYNIEVSADGFRTLNLKTIDVRASVITSTDAKLEVGAVSDTVSVEARPNEIQTQSGEMSGTIPTAEITQVPVAGLNAIALVLTQPGVVDVGSNNFSNGVGFSVNGSRPRANNFLIDGQDDNDNSIQGQAFQPSNLQAVQEVTILTNSYSAEFGRGGGSVTNLIYKGGTNNFHGSVYDLYQSSSLNAITAEQGLAGVTNERCPTCQNKPRSDTHTFGFTVGGPIIKDKLFAFGSSQWQRFYGNASPGTLRLPTDAGVAALQSIGPNPNVNLLLQYIGSLRGNPINTPINVSIGNRAGCGNPCQIETGLVTRTPPAQLSPDTQWTYKVDFNPRTSDLISVRYFHDRNSLSPDFFNFPTSLPGLDPQQGGPSENFGVTWTHTLSSNAVNEFRASEGRFDFTFGPTPEAAANPLFALPTIAISGIASFPSLGLNAGLPQSRGHTTYQVQDAYTLNHGKQTFKVGGDVVRELDRDGVPINTRGTLGFSQSPGFTSLANFVDNFTGISNGASLTFGDPTVRPRLFQQAYYFQDTWRVASNFTLDLGIRYEFQNNPQNVLPFPAVDLAVEPSSTFPVPTKVREDGNNWGPRVGFAYTPHFFHKLFGDDKTVFRGGYGIFYDTIFTNILDNGAAGSPNAVVGQLLGTTGRGLANATGLFSGITPVLNPKSAVSAVDKNLRNPMTHQWNFNIQRELPLNLLFTAAYIGNRGERLLVNDQGNPGNGTNVRLNPARGSITIRDNGGDSIYHGLDLKLDRRFKHGLLIRGAYTFSKLIDNGSEVFTITGGSSFPQMSTTPGNFAAARNLERGLSAYDRRQRLVLTYIYDIPGWKNQSNLAESALSYVTRGWQISGTTAFQSGAPDTVFIGGIDTNQDLNSFNGRPNVGNLSAPFTSFAIDGSFVGGTPGTLYDGPSSQNGTLTPVSATSVRWLIQPGVGNAGRNNALNPGRQDWTIAVARSFGVPRLEGHKVEFRTEMFNPFNHPNQGLGGSQGGVDFNLLDGSNFGDTFQSREGGRQIRFQLKYSF